MAENIGFGLDMLQAPVSEKAQRINAMLTLVKLAGMGDRRCGQLTDDEVHHEEDACPKGEGRREDEERGNGRRPALLVSGSLDAPRCIDDQAATLRICAHMLTPLASEPAIGPAGAGQNLRSSS